jgi:hypothetical protein
MNRKTHPSKEALDEFCREIVSAAQASEDDIQAAANAPFLYQRLRAQIAAEQKPIAAIAPQRSGLKNFVAAVGAFQNRWRWAFAAAVAVLAVVIGWQARKPAAPQVASQSVTPSVAPTAAQGTVEAPPTPTHRETEHDIKPEPIVSPAQIATKAKAAKATPNKAPRRVAEERNAEVATEFLPLTYTTNWEDQRGQIVRMEMPRSVLATMGVPTTNVIGDRVKADVMLGDDGVALAIRFIQ